MEKIKIDRSKWRCGGGLGHRNAKGLGLTMLENTEGYMCCLGFITKHYYPDLDILGEEYPRDVGAEVPHLSKRDLGRLADTDFTDEMININDDSDISAELREARIRGAAAAQGIEIIFEGQYE